MLLPTLLTRFLSAIPLTSYPQCSTSNITITSPARDLKSVDINTPLNLTWTSHPATDPECLEMNVRYRDTRSHEDSSDWIDTLAVPTTPQWLAIHFRVEESESAFWKRPGALVTIEIARKKHEWEVYDRVGPFTLTDNAGPFTLTDNASLRHHDKPELRARHHPMNGGQGNWNDWQDDAPSTPASSAPTTTAVTIDSSTPPPASSSYSSTTTKTVTLELSASLNQPSAADDPLSISFPLTSTPETTTTASAPSTATTTLASSDFAPHTPSITTSILSVTVNPLPQSTSSISLPSSEARTPAAAPPAASPTPPSSPATRPRPSSLPTFLVSAAAALALTGTIIVGGAREVKALTWRMGNRSWSWPSAKEVKEVVVKGTGA